MNSGKNMQGSDTEWSWIVAGACCFTNFILYGIARLSGLLLVAAIDEFDISREAASFPFSASSSVRNLVGPVAGFLGQHFGIRPIAVVGCILTSVGAGLCFFTTDIIWITVFWGGIYGAGFGFGSTLVPVVVNQYFNKYRGTASGISYAGSYIGSCAFPGLVEFLLDTYGLSGTFLIISGIVMNSLISALLFTPPSWFSVNEAKNVHAIAQKKEDAISLSEPKYSLNQSFEPNRVPTSFPKAKNAIRNSKQGYRNSSVSSVVSDSDIFSSFLASYEASRVTCVRKTFVSPEFSTSENVLTSREDKLLEPKNTCNKCTDSLHRNSFPLCRVQKTFNKMKTVEGNRLLLTNIRHSTKNKESVMKFNSITVGEAKYFRNENLLRAVVSSFFMEFKQNAISCAQRAHMGDARNDFSNNTNAERSSKTVAIPFSSSKMFISNSLNVKNKSNFYNSLKIFVDPVFLMISISIAIYTFIIVCMLTIIKDFSRDINIPHSLQQYPLIVQSVADLIGTVSLGWITDRGLLTRRTFIAICFFGMGISVIAIGFASHIVVLLPLLAFYGIFEGGVVITIPLLTAQYIAPEKHTVALASSNVFSAPACLTVPIVIGYFRDHLGSYQGLFFLLGAESLLCSIFWICVPYIVIWRNNQRQVLNSKSGQVIESNI